MDGIASKLPADMESDDAVLESATKSVKFKISRGPPNTLRLVVARYDDSVGSRHGATLCLVVSIKLSDECCEERGMTGVKRVVGAASRIRCNVSVTNVEVSE